VIVVVDKIF